MSAAGSGGGWSDAIEARADDAERDGEYAWGEEAIDAVRRLVAVVRKIEALCDEAWGTDDPFRKRVRAVIEAGEDLRDTENRNEGT